MKKRPFFSIVIPTFNRANELKIAIKCVLSQEFKNFEVIILDNASSDLTKEVVKQFKDKRIRLVVNKTNIGWISSLKKGLSLSSGEYIILQGDDDYMFSDLVLKNLHRLISKYKLGYIRLNYISYLTWKHKLVDFKLNKKNSKDQRISSYSRDEDILEFIEKTDPFFIAGIVFKNNYPGNFKIINSELAPWFKIIFFNARAYGGYFSSNYSFISSWHERKDNSSHPFYRLENNKFTFEYYLKEVKKIRDDKGEDFLKERIKQIVFLFPANKHSTNNLNLIKCAGRVIKLSPNLKFSPFFWFWFVLALVSPKIILGLIRKVLLKRLIDEGVSNKFNLTKKNKLFLNTLKNF